MRSSERRLVITAVGAPMAALMLAACQPPQRPFAPGEAARLSSILDLAGSGGVVVLAVAGAPDRLSGEIAGRMAAALRARNIPAATGGGNIRSRFLQGWLTTAPGADGRVRIEVEWDLFEPDGSPTGGRPARIETERYRWESGDTSVFDALIDRPADDLAALIQGPAPPDAAVALKLPLFVSAVTGAPGDGDQALRNAMTAALRRLGFRLADRAAANGLTIAGRVSLGAPQAGRQEIAIVWSVRRPDGAELGNLGQKNAVPTGSLDGAWGATAGAVAEGAVDGIRELLGRIPRNLLPSDSAGAGG